MENLTVFHPFFAIGISQCRMQNNFKKWLIPDIGVVYSSTFGFGPKPRDSIAHAHGPGLSDTPKLLAA
jgi:hypothetical protein